MTSTYIYYVLQAASVTVRHELLAAIAANVVVQSPQAAIG